MEIIQIRVTQLSFGHELSFLITSGTDSRIAIDLFESCNVVYEVSASDGFSLVKCLCGIYSHLSYGTKYACKQNTNTFSTSPGKSDIQMLHAG